MCFPDTFAGGAVLSDVYADAIAVHYLRKSEDLANNNMHDSEVVKQQA